MRVLICLYLSACSRPLLRFAPEARPTALQYAHNELIATRGVSVATPPPTVSGAAATQFSVVPGLPRGLALDPGSGAITGAPSELLAQTLFRVSAENSAGSATTELLVSVIDSPLASLSYAGAPFHLGRGVQIAPLPPILGGDFADTYTVSPALPPGLVLNNGVLSGRPLFVTPEQTYTITATNSVSKVETSFALSVDDTQLSIAPPSATLRASVGEQMQFAATGGVPPYRFRLVSGAGTMDADGLYTAGDRTGAVVVAALDAFGAEARASVRVVRAITNGPVDATLLTEDSLYLGGRFSRINPLPIAAIAALRNGVADLDPMFDAAGGFDREVLALASDGTSIFAGGRFSLYQNEPSANIVKFDARTGARDSAFNAALGFNGPVHALLLTGNALYVGGKFSAYRGQPAEGLAKLDATTGELDTQFTQACGLTRFPGVRTISALALSGNKLFVGGDFEAYRQCMDVYAGVYDSLPGGAWARNLIALDAVSGDVIAGTSGGVFDADGGGLIGGGSNGVLSLAEDAGTLFVAGDFTLLGECEAVPNGLCPSYEPIANVIAVDSNTGIVRTDFAAPAVTNPQVLALGHDALFVGADALVVRTDRHGANPVARTVGGLVRTLALSGTRLLIAGEFYGVTGVSGSLPGLATLNATDLTPVGRVVDLTGKMRDDTAVAYDRRAFVSALFASGDRTWVGGNFLYAGGQPASHVAKFNLATLRADPVFVHEGAVNGDVSSLAFATSPQRLLYVAGKMSQARGSAVGGFAAFDPDTGALDAHFTGDPGGTNNGISKLVRLPVSGRLVLATYDSDVYRGSAPGHLFFVNAHGTLLHAVSMSERAVDLGVSTTLSVGGFGAVLNDFVCTAGGMDSVVAVVPTGIAPTGTINQCASPPCAVSNFACFSSDATLMSPPGYGFTASAGNCASNFAAGFRASEATAFPDQQLVLHQCNLFNSGAVLPMSAVYLDSYGVSYPAADKHTFVPSMPSWQALSTSGTRAYVAAANFSLDGSTQFGVLALDLERLDRTKFTIDSFDIGAGPDGPIRSLAASDLAVVIAGDFRHFQGELLQNAVVVDPTFGRPQP